jgi:hypothetical protein
MVIAQLDLGPSLIRSQNNRISKRNLADGVAVFILHLKCPR